MTRGRLSARARQGSSRHIGRAWRLAAAMLAIIPALLATFVATPARAAASLYATPSGVNVAAGQSVDFQVRINTGGEAINAVDFSVMYPASALTYTSIDGTGSKFPLAVMADDTGSAVHLVRSVQGGQSALSGDLLVATLRFTAKTSANVSLGFTSDAQALRGSDASNLLAAPSVTIATPKLTATVRTATPAPTPTLTPTPTVTPEPSPSATPIPAAETSDIAVQSGTPARAFDPVTVGAMTLGGLLLAAALIFAAFKFANRRRAQPSPVSQPISPVPTQNPPVTTTQATPPDPGQSSSSGPDQTPPDPGR